MTASTQATHALRDALHLLSTSPTDPAATTRALARTLRASSALKQASAQVKGAAR